MEGLISQNHKSKFLSPALFCFLIIGWIAFVAIPFESYSAEQEFRIGISASLKMEAGVAMNQASEMAAEEINGKGGILGRQIKLFSADDENNPEKGIMAYKNLVERRKVHILVGAATSGVLLAQMDYLEKDKIIFINTGASSPLIAERVVKNYEKYKYQFRICFNSLALAKAISEDQIGYFMKNGYKKFAILAEDAAWNRGLVGFLQKKIPEQGGTITTTINFDTNTIDYAPIFSRIASSGAEMVINLIAITDVITLYRQWYEMKAPFRMGGFNNPGMHGEFWKKTKGTCLSEVNIFNGTVRAPITPKTIPFFDKYQAKFGVTPHACGGWTYDGIYVIADAIQRAQSFETDALIKSLEETAFIGIMGRVVIDKKSHDSLFAPDYQPFLITQWQEGGKLAILWPEKFSDGKFQSPPWLK